MLALEDLKNMSEDEIKNHLISNYSDECYDDDDKQKVAQNKVKDTLSNLDILIAYESVGNWGCESSSFYLFKDKTTNEFYELYGSHCSCCGFEGQFQLELSSVNHLKSKSFEYIYGGYDNNEEYNKTEIKNYINNL